MKKYQVSYLYIVIYFQIFIHASPLKETSTRKHELEVEVVLVVEKEDYGRYDESSGWQR